MSSKRAAWTKRIEAWRSSGESVAGFCRSHGLIYAQFVYWQRVLQAVQAGNLRVRNLRVRSCRNLRVRSCIAKKPQGQI